MILALNDRLQSSRYEETDERYSVRWCVRRTAFSDTPTDCPPDSPKDSGRDIDITWARHMIWRTEYDILQTGEK
jgi:hypothetical protein